MDNTVWAGVDAYIEERLIPRDPAMAAVLAANRAARLPAIDVSPAQGKFLNLLVRMTGAKRVLEIGTLGAYSSIWMARALGTGSRLVTIEFSPEHARVARHNIDAAGLGDVIELRQGRAVDVLPAIEAEGAAPFDLVFIDADKPSNPVYLDWAVRLGRPGTVIVCDNVIRDGEVTDAASSNGSVQGSRAAFDFFHAHPRLSATALQTVGAKGYDGFAIAILGD